MATGFFNWSRTPALNANATYTFAEGQAPSSLNDSNRGIMSDAAQWRDDISGAIVTGGTSTAYTVTSYQVFTTLALMNGQMIAFSPHATNGATVTLNVDGLGAKPLRSSPSVELLAGVLVQGTPYVATYNNSDAAWYLHGFFGNPYNVPIAGGMDFWGTGVPNSSFAFPIGQAISRTTYSALFTIMSTTYGIGDGSTTFNLPDKTGRVSAMKEASATRLTSTYFVGDSTAMGAVGGGESKTLVTGNLPAYTPAGTISTATGTSSGAGSGFSVSGGGTTLLTSGTSALAINPQTFTGSAQGGTSTPFRTVQPTIVCNYIIRLI